MKAYIGNIDWADEGDVFFFSVEEEGRLQALKELLKIVTKLKITPPTVEMYWGTNEFFRFSTEKLLRFIE